MGRAGRLTSRNSKEDESRSSFCQSGLELYRWYINSNLEIPENGIIKDLESNNKKAAIIYSTEAVPRSAGLLGDASSFSP